MPDVEGGTEDPTVSTSVRWALSTSGVAYALNGAFLGAWAPYWPVYVTSIGVSTSMIGVLAAIPAAIQIFAAPAWGLLSDRVGGTRAPLAAAAAIGVVFAIALASGPPIGLLVTCVAILAVGMSAWYPLLDSRTVAVLGRSRDRFGQARVFGSIGFVIVALATGFLMDAAGPLAMFWVYVPLTALAGLWALVAFRRGETAHSSAAVGPRQVLRLLGVPTLLLLFVGSILVWGSFFGAGAYLSVRLVALSGDARLVGVGWAINTLAELPVMLIFRPAARRVGVPSLIVVGTVALCVRNLGWAVADDGRATVAVAALSGITFSLVFVGVTTWLPDHVPPRFRASAQALFLSTTAAVGTILGSLSAGIVVGSLGLEAMFYGAAAVAAAGVLVMAMALRQGTRSARGLTGATAIGSPDAS